MIDINSAILKYKRFTIILDENRFFLYSNTNALLKSGNYNQCVEYADLLEGML